MLNSYFGVATTAILELYQLYSELYQLCTEPYQLCTEPYQLFSELYQLLFCRLNHLPDTSSEGATNEWADDEDPEVDECGTTLEDGRSQ